MANDHREPPNAPPAQTASHTFRQSDVLRPARLFTSFGTQLHVDRSTGELRHSPIGSVPSDVTLVAAEGFGPGRKSGRLVCDVDGVKRQFIYGFDRCVVEDSNVGSGDAAAAYALEVVALERGLFALSAGDRFLMADPGGRVRLCAPVCSTWEFFLTSEEWCGLRTEDDLGERSDWRGLRIDQSALQHYNVHPLVRREIGVRPTEYDFTVDWFALHIPVWNQLLDRLEPRRMIEIGSYEGRSACHLIERYGQRAPLQLLCVDTWQGGFEHSPAEMSHVERRFDHNMAVAVSRSSHPVTVRKIKKSSALALAELIASEEAPFDFIYIDGSHSACDVLADAVLSFQLLRVGGMMIFDDYLWSNNPKGEEDNFLMPKDAIDSFVNLYRRRIDLILGLPLMQFHIMKRS
jgi:predicted O-methyltransferase YrrM